MHHTRGLFNYCATYKFHYETVEKIEGRYQLNQLMIEVIAKLSCNNTLSITIPITYTHQYLHEYWPLATNHRPFIRDMRAVLSEMGLFTYKPMQPREGATRQDDVNFRNFLMWWKSS